MLSPVEEIKNKLDIVEVISGYIKLQKAGRNFRANCPFHHEKTPSFMVSPERQIWHCFGCGKGGDIFGFVKEIEGLEFSDTLKMLAQRAGVVLKKQDPKLKTEKQRLFEICELATKFFAKQLDNGATGAKIKKYLLNRGLGAETIIAWRLGYAPDDWHALSKFLKSRGYKDEEIIKSGLVVEKETANSRSYYDRFRDRIIFPVADTNGQIVGFAGRVAPGGDDKNAKYINTPQTLIYDKSHILYGLDKAKLEMRQKNYCIIVEGNIDVIMSGQAGAKNTIASSGTALTADHLKIIRRYTENVALAFDLDLAGDSATKRAIDMAIFQGFNVKVITFSHKPGGQKSDPADVIKESPGKWLKAIENSKGIIEFYFENLFNKNNSSEVGGKKEIARILLPLLKKIPNKIEQAHWIQELSKRLSVQEKFLSDAIKEIKISEPTRGRLVAPLKPAAASGKSRQDALEKELLAMLLCSADVKQMMIELEAMVKYTGFENLFFNSLLLKIMLNLKQFINRLKPASDFDLREWQSQLDDDLRQEIDQIIFQFEIKQGNKEILLKQIIYCASELQAGQNKRQRIELQKQLKLAEESKNEKEKKRLAKDFSKLAKEAEEIKKFKNKK